MVIPTLHSSGQGIVKHMLMSSEKVFTLASRNLFVKAAQQIMLVVILFCCFFFLFI